MRVEARPQSWGVRYLFHCPGCNGGHSFDCRTDGGRPSWSFDGNLNRPTFSPSLLIRCSGWSRIEEDGWLTYHREGHTSYRVPRSTMGADCPPTIEGVAAKLGLAPDLATISGWVRDLLHRMPPAVCHSFVRAGRIEFLSDCTHALTGKTVDLPEID